MGIDLFDKGGLVMYVLAAFSVYSLGVILYKVYQFSTSRVYKKDFIEPAMAAIRREEYDRVEQVLARLPGPIARVMLVSMQCVTNRDMTQQSREAEVARVGSAEVRYLEQHMRGLEMVANISPLLGLLGTVVGMVRAFSKLEEAGSRVDPSLLAGGIWEALLTTVGGLVVGIMAMVAHYLIDSVVERTRATMKDLAVRILTMDDELTVKEARVEAEKEGKPLESFVPQSQSTLRLLNPRYGM